MQFSGKRAFLTAKMAKTEDMKHTGGGIRGEEQGGKGSWSMVSSKEW